MDGDIHLDTNLLQDLNIAMHDPWWWLIMYQFPINMEMWLTFWLEQPTGVGSKGSGGRQAEAHVVNKSPSGGRGKRGEFDG